MEGHDRNGEQGVTPSVLNPPKQRAPRFLLPAAAVVRNGAQAVDGVLATSIYPKRHIYVLEGSTAALQDGTREHPYGSLSEVMADPALRKVCSYLACDYIHIHLKTSGKLSYENTVDRPFSAVFDGKGYDFKGRLIVEPWDGEDFAEVVAEVNTVFTFADWNGKDWHEEFRKVMAGSHAFGDFWHERHDMPEKQPTGISAAIFRDFHGVFFYRVRATLSVLFTYTGYLEDYFGNNSPTNPLTVNADAFAFSGCDGAGLYKCEASAEVVAELQYPDPRDVLYVDGTPPGEAGSGVGGDGFWLSPDGYAGIGFDSFTLSPLGWEHRDEVFWLFPGGAFRANIAALANSKRTRTADTKLSASARLNTVFGCMANTAATLNASGQYARNISETSSADCRDREIVYITEYHYTNKKREEAFTMSRGAYATAFTVGNGGAHRSTFKGLKITSEAHAEAVKSPHVDTFSPLFGTYAIAGGYSQSPECMRDDEGQWNASAVSPWNGYTYENAARDVEPPKKVTISTP